MDKFENIFSRMMFLATLEGYRKVSDLAKKLGYKSPEKLYRLERDAKAKPSADILIDFANAFETANMDWILTGKGPHYKSSADQMDTNEQNEARFKIWSNAHDDEEHSADKKIPYYNINLAETTSNSLVVMEENPDYFVSYRPFNDCSAYIPVYGDSMYPRYASGEIIAVKEIKNLDVIQWGEAYVIIANENANNIKSIKIIHEHPDTDKVILRSSNPNFKGDTIIRKKDIVSLYIIKGKITRNMI